MIVFILISYQHEIRRTIKRHRNLINTDTCYNLRKKFGYCAVAIGDGCAVNNKILI